MGRVEDQAPGNADAQNDETQPGLRTRPASQATAQSITSGNRAQDRPDHKRPICQ